MENSLNSEQLNYVFNNMEDAVCVTSRNGTILYTNPSAEKLFAFSTYGRDGIKIWEAIPFVEKNDILIQIFIDVVTLHKQIKNSLVKYENNQGKIFTLHISITITQDEEERVLFVIRDLTRLFKLNSAFVRYTSPAIAEYVLNTPEGEKQGGQTREVTILMSDLRGFTALSTKLSPSDLVIMLNNYFENMTKVIEKYHGTVIEFLGDGIFIVFGAPKHDPNHAFNAVACAVEMENAMSHVNEWNVQNDFPELEMGIGINSGYAVVGNIGSDEKMKYGCMGETVNLAGRVETFTIGGQIYISERTKALITENLIIAGEQSFMPKGAKEHLKIFEVEGIGEILKTDSHKNITWHEVAHDVMFYKMAGKTVEEISHSGKIIKISDDEKYGVLQTESSLEKLQNIMIDIGQNLYAKVTDIHEHDYTICFTSKPEAFVNICK